MTWPHPQSSTRFDDRLRFCCVCLRAIGAFLDVRDPPVPFVIAYMSNLAQSFGENHLNAVWRLSLGLGVVPAALVFLWRLNMDEPERYKKDSMKHVRIPYLLIFKRYWVSLAAISFTWFLYDVIVYPVSNSRCSK